jgi:trans-2,3-dihydro-3-hydroxyanthranilate isomerase
VFTSQPYSGNGLAVVHDADDLDEAAMLAFARETRLSETTFVQEPTADKADYRNRIFDVFDELPFAGHPSLGTAAAVARRRGDSQASYLQQTAAGLQPIDVKLDGDLARVSMLQQPAVLGEPIDVTRAAYALSLTPEQISDELPVCAGSTGLNHLLVPLRDTVALAAARPSAQAHRDLVTATGTFVIYAFVADGDRVDARGFHEHIGGIGEDPATGSAAGPLAAYIKQHLGHDRITIAQGEQMGRPSRIDAEVTEDGVTIAGDVVVIMDGELVG